MLVIPSFLCVFIFLSRLKFCSVDKLHLFCFESVDCHGNREERCLSWHLKRCWCLLLQYDNQKVVKGIEIDDNGNLEDLLRVVFIDEECRNLKVVIDSGKLIRNINQKKKSHVLRAFRSPLCEKCCRREHLFNKQVQHKINITFLVVLVVRFFLWLGST